MTPKKKRVDAKDDKFMAYLTLAFMFCGFFYIRSAVIFVGLAIILVGDDINKTLSKRIRP